MVRCPGVTHTTATVTDTVVTQRLFVAITSRLCTHDTQSHCKHCRLCWWFVSTRPINRILKRRKVRLIELDKTQWKSEFEVVTYENQDAETIMSRIKSKGNVKTMPINYYKQSKRMTIKSKLKILFTRTIEILWTWKPQYCTINMANNIVEIKYDDIFKAYDSWSKEALSDSSKTTMNLSVIKYINSLYINTLKREYPIKN